MKSILISIQPKWCAKIASGKKTIEVRKTCQKIDTPFKCYIYCTKSVQKNRIQKVNDTGAIYFDSDLFCPYLEDEIEVLNGRVIGEFVCGYISHSNEHLFDETKLTMQNLIKASCMSIEEINKYRDGKNIFAWHISDLKIYDEPKELNEFCGLCNRLPVEGRAPCFECPYYDYSKFHCARIITRPPQDWRYALELNKLMVGGVEW